MSLVSNVDSPLVLRRHARAQCYVYHLACYDSSTTVYLHLRNFEWPPYPLVPLQLVASEHEQLLRVTGEEPVAYDDELWMNLFNFKVSLDSLTAEEVALDFQPYVDRLREYNKRENLAVSGVLVQRNLQFVAFSPPPAPLRSTKRCALA